MLALLFTALGLHGSSVIRIPPDIYALMTPVGLSAIIVSSVGAFLLGYTSDGTPPDDIR
jgi:hypothetical protein